MSSEAVMSISVHRRLDGIEFTLKSESLERLMRHLSNGTLVRCEVPRTRQPRMDDEERVTPRPSSTPSVGYAGPARRYEILLREGIPVQLQGFNAGRFDLWGSPELVLSRGPRFNLSWLLAEGSENGVTVTIPTVMSDKLLTEYLEGLKSAFRQIYIDFLGDRTHTITITTEHSVA